MTDWTPVCYGDPVPGDPGTVQRMARHYTDVADAIDDAAAGLRRLVSSNDDMSSDAVDVFNTNAADVADDISRAEERYREVGEALGEYWPVLARAQDEAENALRAYRLADPEEGLAASPELVRARDRVDQAQAMRDRAAERARSRIHDVRKSGDLKDSAWTNWGSKVTHFVQKWASRIAMAAGIAALLVSWIPIIGQALAAVLGAVALVFTVISLVANIVLMMAGEGSWLDLGLDVVSLATFGLGRLAGTALKAGVTAERGAVRLAAGQLARGTSRPLTSISGTRAVSQVSRGQARNMVNAGRRFTEASSIRNFLSAQRGVFGEAAEGATVFRQQWRTTFSHMGEGVQNIRQFGLTGVYGNVDALRHAQLVDDLRPAVSGSGDVAKWISFTSDANLNLTVSNLVGNANDGYNFVQTIGAR